MTSGELEVIRALLPPDSDQSERLLSQAKNAPGVTRHLVERHSYRTSIPYVQTDSYLIELDKDCVSPPLKVTDSLSGRTLTFTVALARGGFLAHLDGSADDGGDWPITWAVKLPIAGAFTPEHGEWLPRPMPSETRTQILRALAVWAGREPAKIAGCRGGILGVGWPATEREIIAAQTRLGCELPPQYQEFVGICNGLSIRYGRPYEILGTADSYRHDLPVTGNPAIAITILYEEGLVVLGCSSSETDKTYVIRSNARTPELIGDLRTHVRESLGWLEGLQSV